LGNDVPCPLDHHGIADADIDGFIAANRQAVAVDALDIVLVVEGDVFDHDAPHRHRLETRDGGQRAGAADLDIDSPDGGGCLFGGEFVGDGPARLARDETPAALQFELVDLVDDAIDV